MCVVLINNNLQCLQIISLCYLTLYCPWGALRSSSCMALPLQRSFQFCYIRLDKLCLRRAQLLGFYNSLYFGIIVTSSARGCHMALNCYKEKGAYYSRFILTHWPPQGAPHIDLPSVVNDQFLFKFFSSLFDKLNICLLKILIEFIKRPARTTVKSCFCSYLDLWLLVRLLFNVLMNSEQKLWSNVDEVLAVRLFSLQWTRPQQIQLAIQIHL